MQAGSTINVTNPTIAVMNDALWVGGVGTGRAARCASTNRRCGRCPRAPAGVVVDEGADRGFDLSAGVADLWVYETQRRRQLYCVDSHSGAVLQRWDGITQSVATGGSGPYVVSVGHDRAAGAARQLPVG